MVFVFKKIFETLDLKSAYAELLTFFAVNLTLRFRKISDVPVDVRLICGISSEISLSRSRLINPRGGSPSPSVLVKAVDGMFIVTAIVASSAFSETFTDL